MTRDKRRCGAAQAARGSDGLLLLFNSAVQRTADELSEAAAHFGGERDFQSCPRMLVSWGGANGGERAVTEAEGRRLAQSWGCSYTAAQDRATVNACFEQLVRETLKARAIASQASAKKKCVVM